MIGDVGILLAEIDGILEHDLGYIIHSPHWNHAYATEAVQACLDYGIEQFGLFRLCANMPQHHTASRRIAEKIGMRFEKSFENRRNRNILTCLYAMNVKK